MIREALPPHLADLRIEKKTGGNAFNHRGKLNDDSSLALARLPASAATAATEANATAPAAAAVRAGAPLASVRSCRVALCN